LFTFGNIISHPAPDFGPDFGAMASDLISGVQNEALAGVAKGLENDGDFSEIKELFETGDNGLKFATKLLGFSKDTVEEIDELFEEAEESISNIKAKSSAIELEKFNFTRIFFDNFNSAKMELLAARTELLSLSLKTDHACENLQILFQYWDDTTPEMIKQQLKIMKRLLDESTVALKNAKEKYASLLGIWNSIKGDITNFQTKIQAMTEEESEEYKNWAEKLRKMAFLPLVPVTVGMIVADVFGCFGACSGIVATGTWTVTAITVEKKIAEYRNELTALEEQTKRALKDLDTLDNTCEETIDELLNELELINNWSEAIEKVKRSMKIFSAEQLKEYARYKDKFLYTIRELRDAANNLNKFKTSSDTQLE